MQLKIDKKKKYFEKTLSVLLLYEGSLLTEVLISDKAKGRDFNPETNL